MTSFGGFSNAKSNELATAIPHLLDAKIGLHCQMPGVLAYDRNRNVASKGLTRFVDLIPFPEAIAASDVRDEWNEMVTASASLNRMYASPHWCESLHRFDDAGDMVVAVGRDENGAITCLYPLRLAPFNLTFDVFNRALATTRLKAAWVLGGEPLAPGSQPRRVQLDAIDAILKQLPQCDCLYMDCVDTNGEGWPALLDSSVSRTHRVYVPHGVRPWHWIELQGSFECYLQNWSAKTRQTLRRKVRAFDRVGKQRLQRFETEDEVLAFAGVAQTIAATTWQQRVLGLRAGLNVYRSEWLSDLAKRHLLRAYVLSSAERPCAYLIGYQHDDVFHYAETGFDPTFDAWSPGTILLYRVIEDLFGHRQPRYLNFGMGDGVHKRRFANRSGQDASVLLMRKSTTNAMRHVAHATFAVSVRAAKWITRRRVSK